jgi:cytidyltransferase-like protein
MSRYVIVSGPFDDVRLADFRYLHEASRLGPLRVLLWDDEAVVAATGRPPKFPAAERQYLLGSLRDVDSVELTDEPVRAGPGIADHVLATLPPAEPVPSDPPGRKVLVTGCYDWFHSGHVRFFEECAELGDVYVGVGSDATIQSLKGPGHPMFPADQRRYIVSTCRFVKLAFVSSGAGWLDAEPELKKIRPQIYAVNEDGDKPEKRAFCEKNGIDYVVLRRAPKPGLPRRASTALRGF